MRGQSTAAIGVRFNCMGTCGKYYAASEVKVAHGEVFCSSCFPTTLPAQDVKTPHKRGPLPEWRKR